MSNLAALRARIGGLSCAAQHDPRSYTAKARHTFLSSFEAAADPNGELDPAERARRAEALRKAHFARLALKSAKARAKRKRKTE
jgi:hypothetical protein